MRALIRLLDLLKSSKGSISVEMTAILGVIVLIIVLSFDIGNGLAARVKLDDLSYSIASTLRERQSLYGGRQEIVQEDIENIYRTVRNLSKGAINARLAIVVESALFRSTDINERGEPDVTSFSRGDFVCMPRDSIQSHSNIAFYTSFGRWTNLYRVTLCAELNNLFTPIDNIGVGLLKPISSSIVYGR